MAGKLAALPIGPANSRAFGRHMLGGAMDVDFDNQGRIVLPDYLRKFAGLKKRAVIAGLYGRLEIWDEETWQKYKLGMEAKSGDIAEALGELKI